MTLFVTGGAGFIGSEFIRQSIRKHRIVNFDKLTYAGNLDNLTSVADHPDYSLVVGDVCDAAAVTGVLKNDREEIMRQTQEIQRATASSSAGDAQPRVQLSFSATGVDAHIRYPVHLQNAAEIDERVSQSVFAVLGTLGAASKE